MRIGIDVDGVFAEFNTAFKQLLPMVPETFVPDVWDWPQKYGVTTEQLRTAWETLRASDDFWLSLKPYDDTCEQLLVAERLSESGHDIYFVTAREGTKAKWQTEDWLLRQGSYCPTVIVVPNRQKVEVCSALGLDAMLDDCLTNVGPIAEVCRAYLLDRPWNQASTPASVTRVSTIAHYWAELGL